MKTIQNDMSRPESGPQNVWEFLDKWLHKLAGVSEYVAPIVKFSLIGGLCIYVALVAWRVWLISHLLTTFGVDLTEVLPVSASTAAIIQTGLSVLIWFAPDAIITYVLLNRNVKHWQAWTAVALACAVGASWWSTHEPGVGTHCYVISPDLGLFKTYADKNGQCGLHRGLQMSLVTKEILPAIKALERGIKPHKLAVATLNADEMFDRGDGHSLYWIHENSASTFDFYDGPGFDQITSTPLEPVTRQNAEAIGQHIRQLQSNERTTRDTKEREAKEAELAANRAFDAEKNRVSKANRLEALKLLVNCTDRAATAVAIYPAPQTTADVVEQLAIAARKSSLTIATNFFRPSFFSEGYFDRAYGGDVRPLQEAGAFACVGAVWLGKIESYCGQVINEVVTCDMRLMYRVMDSNGRTLHSGSVSSKGPGFDKHDALQNGSKALIENNSPRILLSLRGG